MRARMQRTGSPIGPPRRLTALGLVALVALTGVSSLGIAAGSAPAPAAAAASEPTPISPKQVNPEVPVDEDGASLGAISAVSRDGATVTLTAAHGAYRVTFLDE